METNERWMAEEIVDFSSTVVSNVIGISKGNSSTKTGEQNSY